MSRKRRSFTTEYEVDAAHRVIDSGRSVAEVALDLGLNEGPLGRWVADERRRLDAASQSGTEPLTAAERDELARLRGHVAGQEKGIAFVKKGVGVLRGKPSTIVCTSGITYLTCGEGDMYRSAIKDEHSYRHSYVHNTELVVAVDNWMSYYNTTRRQSTIGMLPLEL